MGTKAVVAFAMALTAGGLVGLNETTVADGYRQVLPGLLMLGAGAGLAIAPGTASVIGALPRERAGVGSATNGGTADRRCARRRPAGGRAAGCVAGRGCALGVRGRHGAGLGCGRGRGGREHAAGGARPSVAPERAAGRKALRTPGLTALPVARRRISVHRETGKGDDPWKAVAAVWHRRVRNVMTTEVVVVHAQTPFKEVVRALEQDRISGVPVLDGNGVLIGVVSEADLVRTGLAGGGRGAVRRVRRWFRIGRTRRPVGASARDLLTGPPVTVSADASVAEAARLLTRHGIKRLPVVDGAGRLVGIVSAGDLLRVFLRPDRELAEEISREVFERGLGVVVNPATVHVDVREGVATLRGELEYRSTAQAAVALTRNVDGIVDVMDELTFAADDTHRQLPRIDERLAR